MTRMVDIFRVIDADGSGELDRTEFRKGVRTLVGQGQPAHEIDALFDAIDVSCDGAVSYREMFKLLRSPDAVKTSSRTAARGMVASLAKGEKPIERSLDLGEGDDVVRLHPRRKKEVATLYADFKAQHEKGVCKVARFSQLLRIKYPTEDRSHIDAMLQMCADLEEAQKRASAAHGARQMRVEAIFDALDTDNQGFLELPEFLQLSRTTGIEQAKLREVFKARDADGSGALDLDEFKALVDECKLFEHEVAIVEHAAVRKGEKRSKQQLWQIGLPTARKEKAVLPGSSPRRPSLLNVSNLVMNARSAR